jgi:hypothetical protein
MQHCLLVCFTLHWLWVCFTLHWLLVCFTLHWLLVCFTLHWLLVCFTLHPLRLWALGSSPARRVYAMWINLTTHAINNVNQINSQCFVNQTDSTIRYTDFSIVYMFPTFQLAHGKKDWVTCLKNCQFVHFISFQFVSHCIDCQFVSHCIDC